MEKVLNFYETLNERERYILETLEVKKEWLVPEKYYSAIKLMKRMKKRISQLPITREQVISAMQNYDKPFKKVFEGILLICSEDDYPDVTLNMSKILSEENKEIIKMLDVKVEDKEITSKEYLTNSNILANKLLIKYGTGIKEKECDILIKKIEDNLKK